MASGERRIEILSMRPEPLWRDGANPIPGYRVEFRTPGGVTTYVHVPRSERLHEDAAEAMEEEAERIDRVMAAYPRTSHLPGQ